MRWFDTTTRSARILTLIERSFNSTPEQLSKSFKVSKKTVSNEVAKINGELGESAKIEFNNGQYRLYIFDIPKFNEIRESILKPIRDFESQQNRISYLTDLLFNTTEYLLIDDLAFDIDVSRTTINRDLQKLKSLLNGYGITIEGKTNTGIKVKGDEYQIRKFILENNFELIYSRDMFDKEVWDVFHRIMRDYKIDSSNTELISHYLMISLDRFMNGFPVTFEDSFFQTLTNHRLFDVTKRLKAELSSIIGVDIPQEEMIFLTIPLVGMRTPLNILDIEEYLTIEDEIIELIDTIINRIKDETGLTFQFDDTLDEFIYHVTFLSYRLRLGMFLENPIKEEMKVKYPLAWSFATLAASIIEEELGHPINEDEVAYLTSYFEILLREREERFRQNYKVLLIHRKSGTTLKLIIFELKRILDQNAIVTVLSDYEIDESILEGYDLIITTEPLGLETRKPVIELNEVTDEKILSREIEHFRYTRNLDIPMRHSSRSILLSLLDESKVRTFSKDTPYREILEALARKMEVEGLADGGFFERLMEREGKASMRFSDVLAFPHTTHKANNQPFVTVGLLPNGLEEPDYKDLRLVIMAGLPDKAEDDLTLVQLYEEIVKISENTDLIKKLSEAKSYVEILDLLLIQYPIFED